MAKLAVQPAAGTFQRWPPIVPTATFSDAPVGRGGKGDIDGDSEGGDDRDGDGDGDGDGDVGGMHELALVEPSALVQPL